MTPSQKQTAMPSPKRNGSLLLLSVLSSKDSATCITTIPRLVVLEVPRQHPIEFAFDEVDSDAIRNEVMPIEAVPFFSETNSKVEFFDR